MSSDPQLSLTSYDMELSLPSPKRSLDMASVIGVIATFSLIFIAIYIGKSNANFFNVPSFLIVILGTITVTVVSFTSDDLSKSSQILLSSFVSKKINLSQYAGLMMNIAMIAKAKGVLSLAGFKSELKKDPVLYRAIQLVADGYPLKIIDTMLHQELDAQIQRQRLSINILQRAADVAPAMGLIGTLIGLVQMLANLQSPETIGPSMAIALLTTFYGAILGTTVLSPLAVKLERNSIEEAKQRQLMIITIGSITQQENPRQLETSLNSVLSFEEKINYFKD